jgi:hypothetical protein
MGAASWKANRLWLTEFLFDLIREDFSSTDMASKTTGQRV